MGDDEEWRKLSVEDKIVNKLWKARVRIENCFINQFFAPTGAQEVTIFVRPFVRPVLVCLELSIILFRAASVLS